MPTAKKTAKTTKKALKQTQGDSGFGPNQTVQGFAIIETGGKQYRVAVGDTIKVEKLKADSAKGSVEPKEGDSVVFDKVLLTDNGTDATDVGAPYVSGAKVTGTLIKVGRNPKVIVLKYKQKSRYLKKNGHRQPYFQVKIEKIA